MKNTQQKIQELKSTLASKLGGDSLAFRMLDVAICGHMSIEEQEKFLVDINARGLIEDA